MTSSMTQALFKDYVRISERFTSGTLMQKLKINRMASVNLISALLAAQIIIPKFQIGENNKWYERIK